jgi:alanine-synthesizing transaminase
MSFRPVEPAKRAAQVHYAVRDVVLVAREAQSAGKELLYLNIGDPNQFDFETPPHLVDVICQAIRDNKTGYSPSEGLPEAREAIRERAEAVGIRGIRDVYLGNGASECIELALTALVNPGDGVLTPCPGYPLYPAVLAKLGAREVPYYLDEDNGWQPDLADIERKIDPRVRALVLINPNNPTGTVCARDTLERLAELAAKHQLLIFSDEIYDHLLLDKNQHVSIASLRDDLPFVTFNGLSKAYLGPGLRMGWGIISGPDAVLRPYRDAIHKFLRARLCASHPVQYAVAPALRGDQSHIARMMAKLQLRRDVTVGMLRAIPGVTCVAPGAAFYAFPRLEQIGQTDQEFVTGLVRSTGVVVVHGSGFGQRPGTAHFRVVFLPPEDVLRRAFRAIADHLAAVRGRDGSRD